MSDEYERAEDVVPSTFDLLELAETLRRGPMVDASAYREAVLAAASILSVLAQTQVQDQCRQRVPWKPMYRIRDADGQVFLTCDHDPPHLTASNV